MRINAAISVDKLKVCLMQPKETYMYLVNNASEDCIIGCKVLSNEGDRLIFVQEEEETIKKSVRKQDKGKWNASIKKLVAQKKLDRIITGDTFNSFQSEGSCGYYYIHNSKKLNIGDTLKLMVELMNKAKAI